MVDYRAIIQTIDEALERLRREHEAEVEKLTRARETIAALLDQPIPSAPASRAPQGGQKPTQAAAGRDATRGVSGRKPSDESVACRSAILLTLLAAPAPLSFVEVRDAIAPVMAQNGVTDIDRVGEMIRSIASALQNRYQYIARTAGAWKLTDAGRDEALRIRAAVKAQQKTAAA